MYRNHRKPLHPPHSRHPSLMTDLWKKEAGSDGWGVAGVVGVG